MGELGCTLVEEEIIPGLHTSPTSGNGTNASSLTSQGAEQSCEQVLRPRGAQGPGEPGASERSPGSCRVRLEGAGLQRPRLPAGGAAPDAREGPSCGVPRRQRVRPSRWSVRGGARSAPASPQGGGRVAATS